MNKIERLDFWKKVGGDSSATVWTREHLYCYFQRFRPDGCGVEDVFDGVVRGDEVLARLLPFYYHTRDAPKDADFVILTPMPTTQIELFEIMSSYLDKTRQIAAAFEATDLVTLLESVRVEIKSGEPPPHPPVARSNQYYIHEILGDWFQSLVPIQSEVSLLEEAFYFMTGHYELAFYIMWPIYREATTIHDPFAPAFELWLRGADFRFSTDEVLTVYAP